MTPLEELELILRRVYARDESAIAHFRAALAIIVDELTRYNNARRPKAPE